MKTEALRLPSNRSSVYQVWRRNFLQFKRFWLVNFFWIVLEPLLILLAIGYGLGAFVSNIAGISYVDFFFPALLCTSSMMVAFFEASYGNFSKLAHQKTYSTMILSPLDPKQIVLGEILWAATKGTFSALAVALIAGIYGHLDNLMLIPSILVIFLSSFLFAALGMLVTSMVRSYDGIIYPTSGLLVPMSLFSGTYFPLDQLPFGLKYLAYIFPLTHSVSVVRGILFSGISGWQLALHSGLLFVLAVILTRMAIQKITAKLVR